MPLMPIPASLVLAGGLALINLWLSARAAQVRRTTGIYVGDGGNDQLIRRMRAQANLAENAPILFALVLVLELARGTGPVLWVAAGLILLARIAHPIGMDGWKPGRMAGALLTLVLQLALALWALSLPLVGGDAGPAPHGIDLPEPRG
ncbi:hypothetical protein SAMN05192583_2987 [Sphingomonas gellani]|uniref:MAPEG family protein n=1 Tax=Sphingomonas gellani TaxID=1166340 RepID=A0A1H8HCI3_9SPHN|nr:MAPEG family protein [Sphingomonas gellani]SEN53258.1 hypothetical protein SAMN05192583_2987 [Sphingomonas gellani]